MSREKTTIKKIVAEAEDVHDKIIKREKPSMRFPVRSLANVRYTPKRRAGPSTRSARTESAAAR